MSISQNFGNVSPSLLLDFANTKTLDRRITFTRSTPACHYDGKTTAMAEQNLLTNSQNSTTNWTVVANTTTSSATTAPDGTSTALSLVPTTATTNEHLFYQAFTGTDQPYTFSIYAKANGYNWVYFRPQIGGSLLYANFNLSTGTLGFISTGVTATITSVGNGWYRCTATRTMQSIGCFFVVGVSNADGVPSYAGDGTSGVYIWGAQLEARSTATAYTVTTTQPITNYIPVLLTAGGNQARFDHNPTIGESLGLLIEEQRTNIALYSEQFDNGYWVKDNMTLSSNQIVAPSGVLSGDQMTANGVNGNHDIFSSAIISAGNTVFSIYAKKSSGRYIYLSLNNTGNSDYSSVVFDLETGTAGTVVNAGNYSGGQATIIAVGNDWYRVSIAASHSTANEYIFIGIADSLNPSRVGRGRVASTTTASIFIWGAQAETGSFASSYIATTSSSATRTADVASMTGTNFSSWFNNAQGTFVATLSAGTISNGGRVLKISDTDSNRLIDFYLTTTTQSIYSYQNGITSANFSAGTSSTSKYLTAVSYAIGNISALVNGGSVTTSTSAVVSSVANSTFSIGYDPISGASQLSRPIAKIAYYPIQVTSTNLQALTS